MMKLFNLLLSPIGRVTSQPMRNIETFSSKQMYLYLSLVEKKVAKFYNNTWLKLLVFIAFFRTIHGVLVAWPGSLRDVSLTKYNKVLRLLSDSLGFSKLPLH